MAATSQSMIIIQPNKTLYIFIANANIYLVIITIYVTIITVYVAIYVTYYTICQA